VSFLPPPTYFVQPILPANNVKQKKFDEPLFKAMLVGQQIQAKMRPLVSVCSWNSIGFSAGRRSNLSRTWPTA